MSQVETRFDNVCLSLLQIECNDDLYSQADQAYAIVNMTTAQKIDYCGFDKKVQFSLIDKEVAKKCKFRLYQFLYIYIYSYLSSCHSIPCLKCSSWVKELQYWQNMHVL